MTATRTTNATYPDNPDACAGRADCLNPVTDTELGLCDSCLAFARTSDEWDEADARKWHQTERSVAA